MAVLIICIVCSSGLQAAHRFNIFRINELPKPGSCLNIPDLPSPILAAMSVYLTQLISLLYFANTQVSHLHTTAKGMRTYEDKSYLQSTKNVTQQGDRVP